MKKGDIAIIATLFILASVFAYVVTVNKEKLNTSVIVVRDGITLSEFKIDKNYEKTLELDHGKEENIIQISHGEIKMIYANCNDKLCVKSKPISKNGEIIVCLPHKLYVKVVGNDGNDNEIDAIVN